MKIRTRIIYYFVAAAIFLVVGLVGQSVVSNKVRVSFNEKLALASDIVLASFTHDTLENLAAIVTEDTSSNEEYQTLKRKFVDLGNIFWDQGIDALYILVKKGPDLYFMVESSRFGDPLFVDPGTKYEQPPLAVFEVASTNLIVDTEVYTDEYGTYFSRFTPIVHPDSGEQFAILGVDVYYNYFQEELKNAILTFWAIWFIIFLAVVLLFMYLRGVYQVKKISVITEQRIRTIGNVIGDGIIVTDNDDKIAFVNKAAADVFGLEENSVVGKSFESVISIGNILDVELGQELSDFKFSLQSGLAGRIFELTWPTKTGEKEVYEISFALALAGEEEYLVGVFHNITRRKKERLELEKQTTNLEKLNNLMSGRELKMIELKKEILALKESLAKKNK